MVRLLFENRVEHIIFEGGVYFVQCLRRCGYNLQRDTGALFSSAGSFSACSGVATFESGIYSRAVSEVSYMVHIVITECQKASINFDH